MKKKQFIFIAWVIFLSSCIPSLHPIYNNETIHIDDRIIGDWLTEKAGISKKSIEQYSHLDKEIKISNLEIIGDSLYQFSSFDLWQFDRAANIRYDKLNEDGSRSNTAQFDHPLSEIDSALIEKGYTVSSIEKLDYYILKYRDLKDESNNIEYMKIHLTEINGDLYMDFEPKKEDGSESRFSINLIPAHTFAKVKFENGKLIIRSFDSEYIEKLIKNKRVRLKHEIVNETIILTASTEELRAFIQKYGDDDALYSEDEILVAL